MNGYTVVSRRDRGGDRIGGGVIIFAIPVLFDAIITILISVVAERIWCVLHSSLGPFIIMWMV